MLAECRRVLKPGGTIVLSFGMRCNIERATAGWMTRDLAARVQLVADYLDCAGFSNLDSIGHALDRGCSCCPTDSIGGDIFWGRCPNQVRRSPSDGNAIVVAHAAGDHDASSLAREVEAQRDGLHAVGGPANVVLGEIELWSPSGVSADTLERWARSYEALCSEARSLGIPGAAQNEEERRSRAGDVEPYVSRP